MVCYKGCEEYIGQARLDCQEMGGLIFVLGVFAILIYAIYDCLKDSDKAQD